MAIMAWSSEVSTHCPSPDRSRSGERGQHADRRVDASRRVPDRDPGAHRPLARQARYGHETAHPLGDLVEAGAGAVGPRLPEPGDGRRRMIRGFRARKEP